MDLVGFGYTTYLLLLEMINSSSWICFKYLAHGHGEQEDQEEENKEDIG